MSPTAQNTCDIPSTGPLLDLQDLRAEFEDLKRRDNPNRRGEAFEPWLRRLSERHGLPATSFQAADFEVDLDIHLDSEQLFVEAKWERKAAPRAYIDKLYAGVEGRDIYGVVVAIAGFTRDAVRAVENGRFHNIMLIDEEDLEAVLDGRVRWDDLLRIKRAALTSHRRGYLRFNEIQAKPSFWGWSLRALAEERRRLLELETRMSRFPEELGASQSISAFRLSLPPKLAHNPHFLGREEDLAKIHSAFSGDGGFLQSHVCVVGLAGVGKTQLVIEYCLRQYHTRRAKAVLWLNGASADSLLGSLADYATILRIPEASDESADVRASATMTWLRSHTGWIVVVDNVDATSVRDSLLNTFTSGLDGHVIITSRLIQGWPIHCATVELDVLSKDAAKHLLMKRAGDDCGSEDEAQCLVDTIGRLPLAIEAAAIWISRNRAQLSSALLAPSLFDQYRLRLLDPSLRREMFREKVAGGTDYQFSVEECWDVTLQTLDQISLRIVNLVAYLDADSIPVSLFDASADHLIGTEREIARAVQALEVYGLIRRVGKSNLACHRLLQQTLRDRHDSLEAITILKAIIAAEVCIAGRVEINSRAKTCESVLENLWLLSDQDSQHQEWLHCLVEVWIRLGWIRRSQGRLDDSMRALSSALEVSRIESRSEQNSMSWLGELSRVLNCIAQIHLDQGRPEEAVSICEESSEIARYLIAKGSSSPNRMLGLTVALNMLAETRRSQGDLERALKHYLEALGICRRLTRIDPHEVNHTRALSIALENVGRVMRDRKEYHSAYAVSVEAVKICRGLVEANAHDTQAHRDLSVALNRVGAICVDRGEIEEGLRTYEESLSIRRRLVQADPNNAGWLRDLSFSLTAISEAVERQERFGEALRFARESKEIDERLVELDRTNVLWKKDLEESKELLSRLEAADARLRA